MANPSLDRLEQQLGKLVTMYEVLMKNMRKNNEKMKANNAKLYALTAKYMSPRGVESVFRWGGYNCPANR
jgi:hypothetical protein